MSRLASLLRMPSWLEVTVEEDGALDMSDFQFQTQAGAQMSRHGRSDPCHRCCRARPLCGALVCEGCAAHHELGPPLQRLAYTHHCVPALANALHGGCERIALRSPRVRHKPRIVEQRYRHHRFGGRRGR